MPIASTHTDNPITLCLKEGDLYGKLILFYLDRDEPPKVIANTLEEILEINNIDEI